MPTKDEHVTQAKHNQSFWSSQNLNATPFLDWAVTGMFYEAVHWVEALLATKGYHSGSHADRLRAIQHHAELQAIYTDYDILKQDSENARYRCYKHTKEDVQNQLIPLAKNIRSHLSQYI